MSFPIFGHPKQGFFDSNGVPLSSGTLTITDPSTDLFKATYPTADDADAATNANANPLTLDSRGEPGTGFFGVDGETYKVALKDSDGNTIWTVDDVKVPLGSRASIGEVFYPRTTAEIAASVTPTNYFYPEGNVLRYGATGDASTDDLTAAQNLFSVAGNATGEFTCHFPPSDGYAISASVNCPKNVHLKMESPLIYTGSANEAALIVGNTAGYTHTSAHTNLEIYVERSSIGDWSQAGHIGAQLINVQNSNIRIVRVAGFTIGVECIGKGEGFAYNTFTLGALRENKYALKLTNETATDTGFCNENTFFGGRFGVSSTTNTTADRFGIYITSEDATYVNNNDNVFLGTSLEMNAANTSGEAVAIWIEHGQQNRGYGVRFENNDLGLRCSNAAARNVFEGGYTTDDYTVEALGTSSENFIIAAIRPTSYHFNRTVFEVKNLGGIAEGVDGGVKIPGCAWMTSAAATKTQVSSTNVTIDRANGEITFPSTRGIGVFIDTSTTKEFVVKRYGSVGGRVWVQPFASDVIQTGSGNVRGSLDSALAENSSFGNGYRSGSDNLNPIYFIVDSDIDKCFVFIAGGTASAELSGFGIYQFGNATTEFAGSYSGFQESEKNGSETLSSGTASVTFGVAEKDANYQISLSGNANETFYWASKATSGFTINSSNGSSTATVDWRIFR